jgi:DNA-binding transcriptional ArsR family regulator
MVSTDDELWSAIAEPSRRLVLDLVVQSGPATASQLAELVPFTRQAVSLHLAKLEKVGLVDHHKEGRDVLYRVIPDRLSEASQYMRDVGAAWDRRLTAIKQLSETEYLNELSPPKWCTRGSPA